jgi:hypothetical protein
MDGLKKVSAFCVELGKVAGALAAIVAFLVALARTHVFDGT